MVRSNGVAVRITRVLVGVDFSDASAQAATWAARHLAPGAELVLAHAVYVPEPPAFLQGLYPPTGAAAETARAGAEQQVRDLGSAIATGLVWTEVRIGRPDEVLAQIATDYGVDLIVLGRPTERAGVWSRLGSTPERVLRRSTIPVLLAASVDGGAPRRVLAAVDDSELTPHVLAWTDHLLGQTGASATLVHVVAPPLPGVAPDGAAQLSPTAVAVDEGHAAALRSAREWLETRRATLTHAGRVATTALSGGTAAEILAESARQDYDLLVLGAHGGGAVSRLVFGSVAEAVARAASCSVLVVKPAEENARPITPSAS